jgi:hypothetical protein
MCDYSLHAVATRPARVGETLVTTVFRGTSTRGFASESEPEVAVCLRPSAISNLLPVGMGLDQVAAMEAERGTWLIARRNGVLENGRSSPKPRS